jgi:hypothetical protein
MAMLTDLEAIDTRDALSDLTQDRPFDTLDSLTKETALGMQGSLLDYEKSRPIGKAYKTDPSLDSGTLKNIRKVFDGEENLYEGEMNDTPESNKETAKLSYLALRFGKPVEEIANDEDMYDEAIMKITGINDPMGRSQTLIRRRVRSFQREH